ncbi:hydantoinase/carbamoylase family amidase [Methylorubrum thiocyanatum]
MAKTVIDRIERLAQVSAYPWNLTRRVFSPQQAEAEALILGWMEEAGLSARHDPAGNLIGRLEGAVPGGQAVVIGGHVDTASDAGRYVGTLGVLMGIAAVERIVRRGSPQGHAVEVVAFVADAAGRFGIPRLGSRAVTGWFDEHMLDIDDDYGVTLRQAMEAHGLDPEGPAAARRVAGDVLAYLEVAAEAGPVLEQSESPVGVVPALSGSMMLRVTLRGHAVGSATVPTRNRRDALAGTADCILEAERIGLEREDVAVTVVRMDVEPVPTFVVTGSVTFGVLVESSDDAGRRAATAELAVAFKGVAARRGLEIAIEHSVDPDATRCEPGIVQLFERAVESTGHPVTRLAQGMATDASNMALIAPIGLVLVRCRDGVGWGPAGTVDPADIEAGLDVLTFVIGDLANGSDPPADGGSRVNVRLDASAARKPAGGGPS